jgi:hypothetical protein
VRGGGDQRRGKIGKELAARGEKGLQKIENHTQEGKGAEEGRYN